METSIEKIPHWALYYLTYGEYYSLSEKDLTEIEDWRTKNNVQDVFPITDDLDFEPYFTSCPAFGLPTNVIDCNVIFRQTQEVTVE